MLLGVTVFFSCWLPSNSNSKIPVFLRCINIFQFLLLESVFLSYFFPTCVLKASSEIMDALLGREEREARPSMDDPYYQNLAFDLHFREPKNEYEAEEAAYWERRDKQPRCPIVEMIDLKEDSMRKQELAYKTRYAKPKKTRKPRKKNDQGNLKSFIIKKPRTTSGKSKKVNRKAPPKVSLSPSNPGSKKAPPKVSLSPLKPAQNKKAPPSAKAPSKAKATPNTSVVPASSWERKNEQGFPMSQCIFAESLGKHVYQPPTYYEMAKNTFSQEHVCKDCKLSPCMVLGYKGYMKTFTQEIREDLPVSMDPYELNKTIRIASRKELRRIVEGLFSERYYYMNGLPSCVDRDILKKYGSPVAEMMAYASFVLQSDSEDDSDNNKDDDHKDGKDGFDKDVLDSDGSTSEEEFEDRVAEYWTENTKSEGGL